MLKVKDIHVQYGQKKVIHGVSFHVPEGKIISLVGSNGAGKSTIVNTICGLIKPTSGQIEYMGKSIIDVPTYQITRSGLVQVPEGRKLFRNMTVLDNILTAATVLSREVDVEKWLHKIYSFFPRLKERQKQLARTLSGGEQQMLAIARALMTNPKLLILDEPSWGLAPVIVQELFKIIEQLRKEYHLTILLIEQNINLSLKYCDYAYVIEHGSVVLEGSGEELLNNEDTKKAYLGI